MGSLLQTSLLFIHSPQLLWRLEFRTLLPLALHTPQRSASPTLATVFLVLCILPTLSSASAGTSAYYTPPYLPTACYGYDTSEFLPGNMFGAASDPIYNNGAGCGNCYSINCTAVTSQQGFSPCLGGSPVTIVVVDGCPYGCQGTFDLSAEAFAAIANLDAGVIAIDYMEVSCPA